MIANQDALHFVLISMAGNSFRLRNTRVLTWPLVMSISEIRGIREELLNALVPAVQNAVIGSSRG